MDHGHFHFYKVYSRIFNKISLIISLILFRTYLKFLLYLYYCIINFVIYTKMHQHTYTLIIKQ